MSVLSWMFERTIATLGLPGRTIDHRLSPADRTPRTVNFCGLDSVLRQPTMCADPFSGFLLGPKLAKIFGGAVRPRDLNAPKVAHFHQC